MPLHPITVEELRKVLAEFDDTPCARNCELQVKPLEHRGFVVKMGTCRDHDKCVWTRITKATAQ
jgi:hypothetical protein